MAEEPPKVTVRVEAPPEFWKTYGMPISEFAIPITFKRLPKSKTSTIVRMFAFMYFVFLWSLFSYVFITHYEYRSIMTIIIMYALICFFLIAILLQINLIIADFVTDFLEGGAILAVYADGFTDSRISKQKIRFDDLQALTLLSSPYGGVGGIRAKFPLGKICFRRFRLDYMFLRSFPYIFNKYIYIYQEF